MNVLDQFYEVDILWIYSVVSNEKSGPELLVVLI